MTDFLWLLLVYSIKIMGTTVLIIFIWPKKKEFQHIYYLWDFTLFRNIEPKYVPQPILYARKFLIGKLITSTVLGTMCLPILFVLNTLGIMWALTLWSWDFLKLTSKFMSWLCKEKKLVLIVILIMF